MMQQTITFDNANLISYDTFLLYRNMKRDRQLEETSRACLRDAMATLRQKLYEGGFGMGDMVITPGSLTMTTASFTASGATMVRSTAMDSDAPPPHP